MSSAIFGRRYIVIGESCLKMLLFWDLIIQSQADELHTSSNVFRSSKKYIPFSFGVGRALCPFPFPTGISGTEITKTELANDFSVLTYCGPERPFEVKATSF